MCTLRGIETLDLVFQSWCHEFVIDAGVHEGESLYVCWRDLHKHRKTTAVMHAGRIPITAPHELQLLRSRRGKHAAFSLSFQTICLACHNKEQAKQCCKEKHFPPWLHKQVDETAKNCVQLVSSCLSIRLKLLFMSEPWNKPSTLTFLSPYSDLFIYFPFLFPCLSFLSINWPWWLNMQAI